VLESPSPPVALFRLRHVPDQFTLPVQLQIGRGPGAVRRDLDEFAPLGRVEFSFDFTQALQDHLAHPSLAPHCGDGELLANPDFSQPIHDDATYRLFGFDSRRTFSLPLVGNVEIRGTVNLRTERFITLSIDGGLPRIIDCAGANPARTELEEILTAINQAMGTQVASTPEGDRRIRITAQTSEGSVELHPWCRAQLPQGWSGTPGHVLHAKRFNGT